MKLDLAKSINIPNSESKRINNNVILVENSSTGLLSNLIAEKTGIFIDKKILRYDGRPFLADELKKKINRVLK